MVHESMPGMSPEKPMSNWEKERYDSSMEAQKNLLENTKKLFNLLDKNIGDLLRQNPENPPIMNMRRSRESYDSPSVTYGIEDDWKEGEMPENPHNDPDTIDVWFGDQHFGDIDSVKFSEQIYPELYNLVKEVKSGMSGKEKNDLKQKNVESFCHVKGDREIQTFNIEKIGDIYVCDAKYSQIRLQNHKFLLTNSLEVARIWVKDRIDKLSKERERCSNKIRELKAEVSNLDNLIPTLEKTLESSKKDIN